MDASDRSAALTESVDILDTVGIYGVELPRILERLREPVKPSRNWSKLRLGTNSEFSGEGQSKHCVDFKERSNNFLPKINAEWILPPNSVLSLAHFVLFRQSDELLIHAPPLPTRLQRRISSYGLSAARY